MDRNHKLQQYHSFYYYYYYYCDYRIIVAECDHPTKANRRHAFPLPSCRRHTAHRANMLWVRNSRAYYDDEGDSVDGWTRCVLVVVVMDAPDPLHQVRPHMIWMTTTTNIVQSRAFRGWSVPQIVPPIPPFDHIRHCHHHALDHSQRVYQRYYRTWSVVS